jgi:hypothetical protein
MGSSSSLLALQRCVVLASYLVLLHRPWTFRNSSVWWGTYPQVQTQDVS